MVPVNQEVWRLEGDKAARIASQSIESEQRLEDLVNRDISIVDSGALVIGRQVPTAHGGYIDVLALDREGRVVIFELKKDRTPREVVAQILDYGSWIVNLAADE